MKKRFVLIISFIILSTALFLFLTSCVEVKSNDNLIDEDKVYTITWLNDDGSLLVTDTVKENELPVYDGIPTKESNQIYSFSFSGWDKEIVAATEDTTYTATYSSSYIEYTVNFVFNNGQENEVNSYRYGDTIIFPEEPYKNGYTFGGWYYGENKSEGNEEVVSEMTFKAKWYTTTVVNTINDFVKNYLDDSYEDIENYYVEYNIDMQDYSKPYPVVFDWSEMLGGIDYPEYTLYIAEDDEFKKTLKYTTSEKSYCVYNLFVNSRYYWKVSASGYESEINVVLIDGKYPRLIDIDGVTNMRDLGGYLVANGTTSQGLLYRSAKLDNITEFGKETAKCVLGIKTEIDLRGSSEGARSDGFGNGYLGSDVYYYNVPIGYSFTSTDNKQYLQKLFKILANENNYPIVFHCAAGADRTGFIAYLINGLIGVEKEYLYDDYHLTNFAKQGERERYYTNISGYVEAIDNKEGKTLSEKVFNYLNDDKGIDKDDLLCLISIMKTDKERGVISFVPETHTVVYTCQGEVQNIIKVRAGDTAINYVKTGYYEVVWRLYNGDEYDFSYPVYSDINLYCNDPKIIDVENLTFEEGVEISLKENSDDIYGLTFIKAYSVNLVKYSDVFIDTLMCGGDYLIKYVHVSGAAPSVRLKNRNLGDLYSMWIYIESDVVSTISLRDDACAQSHASATNNNNVFTNQWQYITIRIGENLAGFYISESVGGKIKSIYIDNIEKIGDIDTVDIDFEDGMIYGAYISNGWEGVLYTYSTNKIIANSDGGDYALKLFGNNGKGYYRISKNFAIAGDSWTVDIYIDGEGVYTLSAYGCRIDTTTVVGRTWTTITLTCEQTGKLAGFGIQEGINSGVYIDNLRKNNKYMD